MRGSVLHVRELETIFHSIAFQVLLWWALPYAIRALLVPRLLVAIVAVAIIAGTTIGRLVLWSFLLRTLASFGLPSRVLILGVTETGLRLFRKLSQSPQHGFKVIGFLATRPEQLSNGSFLAPSYGGRRTAAQVLGDLSSLEALCAEQRVDGLVIADEINAEQASRVQEFADRGRLSVSVAPATYGLYSHWITYTDVDGVPLGLCQTPGHRSIFSRAAKRAVDVIGALIGLVLAGPICAAMAIAIAIDSPGPVLFRQERVGLQGRVFRMWKFRSMRTDSPAYAPSPRHRDDSRLTRVGRWMRRFSLDEVPQLINVLKGEMSLVGPRPEMPFIVAQYTPYQRERLRVKPGITGLWQISADRANAIHENIEYDLYYLEHQSMALDCVILFNTIFFLIRGIGAW